MQSVVPIALRSTYSSIYRIAHRVVKSAAFPLILGTSLSQALGLACLPFLMQVYEPADFGIFATFTSIVSTLGAVAALRYEVAIPVPKSALRAMVLFLLSVSVAIAFAATLWIPITAGKLFDAVPKEHLSWWFAVPVAVFMLSFYTICSFALVREKNFNSLAVARLIQVSSTLSSQFAIARWLDGPIGLVLGYILGFFVGSLSLAQAVVRDYRPALRYRVLSLMPRTARMFFRFPLYSTPETLAYVASNTLPIILIAAIAGPAEAGFLVIAMRVMQAPMQLIGDAFAKVYIANGPAHFRGGTLGAYTGQVVGWLTVAGIAPFALLAVGVFLLGPSLIEPNWSRTLTLVWWLGPWCIFQFLSAPLTMVMHIVDKQFVQMSLAVFGLTTKIGAILLAYVAFDGFVVEVFAIASAVYAMLALAIYMLAARAKPVGSRNVSRVP